MNAGHLLRPRRHCAPLAATLLLLATAPACADDDWYVGVGRGGVTGDYEVANFDDGSISAGAVDNSDWGWKLFAGFDIGRHLGFEFGYTDLHNDPDDTMTFTGVSDGSGDRYASFPDGDVGVDIDDVTSYYAVAMLSLPLSAHFRLSAKGGITRWEARQATIDLQPIEVSISGTDALTGFAAEYRFDSGIALRAEFERYAGMGSTDQEFFAAAVLFRF